jgi:hypothetical protein
MKVDRLKLSRRWFATILYSKSTKRKSSINTAVHNAWAKHRAVTKPPGFVEYLDGKLAGWCNNQDQGFGLDFHPGLESCRVGSGSGKLLGFAHQLAENWQQVCRRLAEASLENGWNRILLDGVGLS